MEKVKRRRRWRKEKWKMKQLVVKVNEVNGWRRRTIEVVVDLELVEKWGHERERFDTFATRRVGVDLGDKCCNAITYIYVDAAEEAV